MKTQMRMADGSKCLSGNPCDTTPLRGNDGDICPAFSLLERIISEHPYPRWLCAHGLTIPLDRPRVMGILNATPDSFSDGGAFLRVDAAVEHALQMIDEGGDIIDVGGESTRPGAVRVSDSEQIGRTIPIIKQLRSYDVAVSIDTTRSLVAQEAVRAGAHIINDVSGGTEDPEILRVAAETSAGLVLMHRLRPPDEDSYSDQYTVSPTYENVVNDVCDALSAMAQNAMDAGVDPQCIVLDPGLGFGKTVEQNLTLITGTPMIASLGYPVLSGLSRKSFVGRVSIGLTPDRPVPAPHERLAGTVALTVLHALHGASVFRVHDVKRVLEALSATLTAQRLRKIP